jgi:hypothetical protein
MDAQKTWSLAWAKLDAFAKNLPDSVEEKHVAEFHSILDLLHESSGEDTSPFRIPDTEVTPRIASVLRPTRRSPGHATYTTKKYCDDDLMRRKVDEVYGYFKNIQPPPEEPPKPKYGF